MKFEIEPRKLAQVANRFAQKEGGAINILKLVKLVYLADRRSLAQRNRPIAGGSYFSMPYGPVTSELLNAANAQASPQVKRDWEAYFEPRQDHDVKLKSATTRSDELSEAELNIIDDVYKEIGNEDQFRIANWCHEHCQEWDQLESGRKPIEAEDILRALGKSEEEIRQIIGEEAEIDSLKELLG